MTERNIIDRRSFITGCAATYLLQNTPRTLAAQNTHVEAATLSLDTSAPRIPLPADFAGLSYESAQLAHPGYFSRENKSLVALVRQLGSSGVLRIGGSTSDYDTWKQEQLSRNASWSEPANPDDGQGATVRAVVTETAIDELRGFLDATGWTAIYGLDLGHGSPDTAADEAAYVVKRLGPRLKALQMGNEPDLFSRDIRKSTYNYADYFAEWQRFAAAIHRRTPDAPLAGPDITDQISWVDQFARQATGICLLTSHYYAEGPPESPDSDIAHLLQPSSELKDSMQHLVAVGRSVHLPYRMAEGNSCYNGGKPGVSDAFASALWGADFMLLLAQLGVAGVNLHGGGRGFYTPIAGGGSAAFAVRPLYYGMLFYREFASGSLIPCRFDTGGVNATAYACLNSGGRLAVAILNKDVNQDLRLKLEGELQRPSRAIAMTAPSVASTTDIELGGQAVSQSEWRPAWQPRSLRTALVVPQASALLMEFEGVTL
jgi:hypothetical protein